MPATGPCCLRQRMCRWPPGPSNSHVGRMFLAPFISRSSRRAMCQDSSASWRSSDGFGNNSVFPPREFAHNPFLTFELAAIHAHRITGRMIGDSPLISVVVPAFNASQTIRETLRTISQQTYRNLEVIVVDDGSTDNTAALVQEHSLHDPRFRLISQMNGGVASARNTGVHASSGEFIAFIDADDLWHPSKLEKQIAVLLSGGREMALVYCPFRSIDAAGKVLASPRSYAISGG